jgi:hypothetical protein
MNWFSNDFIYTEDSGNEVGPECVMSNTLNESVISQSSDDSSNNIRKSYQVSDFSDIVHC